MLLSTYAYHFNNLLIKSQVFIEKRNIYGRIGLVGGVEMPLMLLGLVLVVGLFIYYLLSTSSGAIASREAKEAKKNGDKDDDDNVIFLPNDLEKEKLKRKFDKFDKPKH